MLCYPWAGHGGVIDAHLHFVTGAMLTRAARQFPRPRRPQAASATRGRRAEDGPATVPPEQLARQWIEVLDRHRIDAGFFIAIGEGSEELATLVRQHPSRCYAWGSVVDATAPGAASDVRRFPQWGLPGLKLYPPFQWFSPGNRAIYPVHEAAAALDLPVLFRFGITIAPTYDLTHASPLRLSVAARDFPDVSFGIAHCGAGFLREALMLAYHTDNIWTDTSGTNNWRLYTLGAPSLDDLFRDLARAYGPHRIVFGTDSTAPERYRADIVREQQEVLERLEVDERDRAAIFTNNARRLLRLSPSVDYDGAPTERRTARATAARGPT
ncbi:MAG TPA: amidohydrolase family protein [bacterium]|nr:amidohydrolase family protein [bacterium]